MNYKSITAVRGRHDGMNWIPDPTGDEISLKFGDVNSENAYILTLTDEDERKLFRALWDLPPRKFNKEASSEARDDEYNPYDS